MNPPSRPLALDLFCCAGGMSVGLHRAGFDVVGVDIDPQPDYPYEFHQGDALDVLRRLLAGETWNGHVLADFAIVHTSPPCQGFSFASRHHPGTQDKYPNLIPPTRELLEATGLPYVIENVPPAPVRKDVVLCGEMFGLRVHRHRSFELGGGVTAVRPAHPKHLLRGARDNCHIEAGHTRQVAGHFSNFPDARDAMGVDWMTRPHDLAEAVPPAYGQYVGELLLDYLRERDA